jgi:hypothetical protein
MAAVSSLSVTDGKWNKQKSEMMAAIGKCESTDKDCAYLAFSTFRHYFPEDEFVKDTLEIQEVMRGMISQCEVEDQDCGALKAYAFSKIFPESEDAAAEDHGLDLSTEANKEFAAQIENCISTNPICTHLIITEFCEMDENKDEACKTTNALNEKFESLISECEGKMGKFCKRQAKKVACKLFEASCKPNLLQRLAKKAAGMKARMAEKLKRLSSKAEVVKMTVALKTCEENDKDCAFLAFKTYSHYFPDSEFVKKTVEFEATMQAAIKTCETEDSDCDALKAYAFKKIFPTSEDAESKAGSLDLENEQNKKFASEIDNCISTNPLCTHMVMAEFCEEDSAEPNCKATLAMDQRFEALIEKCESSDLDNFCKKLSKKGACKFFPESCDE